MRSLLPRFPDDVRVLARRIDTTVRHRGVPDRCILEFDIQSVPPETVGFDPVRMVTGAGRPIALADAVTAIHRAAEDSRVAGLIARVQFTAAPPAAVQELREAVVAFTAAKPSLAWAETYPGTLAYYLASAFGEVWMQPSGTVGLIGFATSAMFLRDALDKAGVEAQFVARGEYKSAANLFTEAHYTDAHREADSRLIESLHEQVWQGVAQSRGVDAGLLNGLADRAPLRRDTATEAGLIDSVGFRDEAYRRIAELADVQHADADPDGDDAPPRLSLSRYAHTRHAVLPAIPGRKRTPVIAVVTVAGPIVSGRGGPQVLPLTRSSAGADAIAAALREVSADEDVAAIVLRVDSPGGVVTGSETIWREVSRIRASGKPVVASMGAVAASGGYYVAMAADHIVASPGTITGSIGVVTGKFVARELKGRFGIGSDAVRTNTNADAWSPNAPFTAEQQDLVEAEADQFYDDFVQRVAQGRDMSTEDVESVARGRVWTGADACERRLVDELGGLRTAVRRAKVLAGLDADADVSVVDYPGSSLRDYLRHKAGAQPAALAPGVAAILGSAAAGLVNGLAPERGDRSQRTHALWAGNTWF